MKILSRQNGRFRYPLHKYSLARVLSFERFHEYFTDLPGGEVVLDYGAGDRPYEEMLGQKFRQYLAADYVATHSRYYSGKSPDILLSGSELPLSSNSVDCVILTEVLEHVYEPRLLLRELQRILKPGGLLLGTVPFAIQQHDEPFDFHRYTYYCLHRMFQDSGFSIQHLDYVGDFVGVCVSNVDTLFGVLPKGLEKIHMRWAAGPVRWLIRVPAFAYYYARKAGLNPGAASYFKRYPLGFAFCLRKLD